MNVLYADALCWVKQEKIFWKSFIYILDFISLTRTYLMVAAAIYLNAFCTAYLCGQFIFVRKNFRIIILQLKIILSIFCIFLSTFTLPSPSSSPLLQLTSAVDPVTTILSIQQHMIQSAPHDPVSTT